MPALRAASGLIDGREIEWRHADLAFTLARNARGEGSMFERWCAKLSAAERALRAEYTAWCRGQDVAITPNEPARGSSYERAVLARLEVPLALVTPRRAPAVAEAEHG